MQELLVDYEDYLRTRRLRQWANDSVEVAKMRELGSRHNDSAFYREFISTRSDETIANIAIVLIHQADFLLYRQLKAAEREFVDDGGFREKMYRVRVSEREKKFGK